jgi:hypothetical protein
MGTLSTGLFGDVLLKKPASFLGYFAGPSAELECQRIRAWEYL